MSWVSPDRPTSSIRVETDELPSLVRKTWCMSQPIVEPRRAFRDRDDRLLGGVAAGVGHHLGVSALNARVGFLVLTLLGGFGALVYAGLWVFLPLATTAPSSLEGVTRRGLRTSTGAEPRRDMGVAVSLAVVGAGAVLLVQNIGLGIDPALFWPLAVASAGLALLWWQTDRPFWSASRSGWVGWLRLSAGVALLATAEALVVFQAGLPDGVLGILLLLGLAVLGIGLVIGPWLLRLSRDLRLERQERIRSEERADVAAHLHDSVLQTLALIQRHASDPQVVASLARTQERQLRTWLFDGPSPDVMTLKSALQNAVEGVEENHRIPVELVVVGDADADDNVVTLVAATREALANAAVHSGADRIDVFAEALTGEVSIYVRDRGVGFDVESVPEGRHGVRRSIIDRVTRHGGSAQIRSRPGQGTEVRLSMPRATRQGSPL